MAIEKLSEFAKDGQKNTDDLNLTDGFPVSKKPARQWFNWLFNTLTSKVNEIIDADFIPKADIVNNLTTDDAKKPVSAKQAKNLQDNKLDKTANAVSSSKLETVRTVSFSGAATGSFNFDGSGNSSCVLALANSGVAANTYGTALKIPTITVNAKGLVTGVSEKEITKANLGLDRFVQNPSLNTAVAAPTVDAAMIITDNGWGIYRNPELINFDQALAISFGGTGATSIAGAKTNLKINRFVQDSYATSMYAPTTDSRIVVTDDGWGVWSISPSFNSALPLTSGGTGRTDGKAQALVNHRIVFGQTFDGSNDVGGTITVSTGLVQTDSFHYIDMGRNGLDRMSFYNYGATFNFIDSQNGNVVARITQNGIDCNAASATDCSRSVIAGNGLSGGGALTSDSTVTLGTPGNITATSTNSVTETSHTHNLDVNSLPFLGTGINKRKSIISGTTYTNTGNRPIFVTCSMSGSSSTAASATLDGRMIFSTNSSNQYSQSFVVGVGVSYSFTGNTLVCEEYS